MLPPRPLLEGDVLLLVNPKPPPSHASQQAPGRPSPLPEASPAATASTPEPPGGPGKAS